MRKALKAIDGQRARFRATYEKEGSRTSGGYFVPMILFVNVTDTHGNEVTDHIWFRKGKTWDDLKLEAGDRVEFEARADMYWKGYIDKIPDWCLKNPTKARKVVATNGNGAKRPDSEFREDVSDDSGQMCLRLR